jgi:general secretion pathway protein M
VKNNQKNPKETQMLSKLDDRERLLIFGGIGVLLFLLFLNIVTNLYNYRVELSQQVIETRSNFTALDKAVQDYNYYRSLKSGDEEKISDIYSKLDQIMLRYSLKDRVQTMKDTNSMILKNYNRTTIDITFRSVPLQDILKLIYDIEMNKQINSKIDYISFRKPIAGKEVYDVNLKLSSYSKLGKKNG